MRHIALRFRDTLEFQARVAVLAEAISLQPVMRSQRLTYSAMLREMLMVGLEQLEDKHRKAIDAVRARRDAEGP